MKLKEQPLFFFDLQTSGPQPEGAEVTEMAWLSPELGEIESFLIRPLRPIPASIFDLTGLTPEDFAETPNFFDVLERFNLFIKHQAADTRMIIHYAQFEKKFLEEAKKIHPLEKDPPIWCTFQMARRLHPNLPTRSLKGLAGYYGYVKDDFKRAPDHIRATQIIWRGLIEDLEKKGIDTSEKLDEWLLEAAPRRTKYEYVLSKDKRLSLPKNPGIYKMKSKTDEVLYVGKATSLKDRVNSYFRGRKGKESRKLELLTQVWDIEVLACDSVLEAALLESDEIKRLNPRYNVALKIGERRMIFYSRDFLSSAQKQEARHPLGPFSSPWPLDSVTKLARSLQNFEPNSQQSQEGSEFDPFIFFEARDPGLLKEGFLLFCREENVEPDFFSSVRNSLAFGLKKLRKEKSLSLTIEAEETKPEPEDLAIENFETAQDLAEKFNRHILRAAAVYLRAKTLTRLLNSDIEIESPEGHLIKTLFFRRGQLRTPKSVGLLDSSTHQWAELDIKDFDRMSIVLSELQKKGCRWKNADK